METYCSASELYPHNLSAIQRSAIGTGDWLRSSALLIMIQALYQLSYTGKSVVNYVGGRGRQRPALVPDDPLREHPPGLVPVERIELSTTPLSVERSTTELYWALANVTRFELAAIS